ncbi:hypothetical protein A3750_04730, partial [Oleiphilus sp. HI0079]|uniref:glycosyltransferase n=3 Tax=unclassified Oleiphilus TaxID=2631174 RepID=UPI0007C37137
KVGSPKSAEFLNQFEQAFPMVDIESQLVQLQPDIIYVHSLNDIETLKRIVAFPCQKIRFFHDQRAFCLRDHKYTTIGKKPCAKKLGLDCYSCLGFLKPSSMPWKVGLRTLGELKASLKLNQQFDRVLVGSNYMAEQLKMHDFDAEKLAVATLFSNALRPADQETPLVLGSSTSSNLADSPVSKRKKQLLFVGQLVTGKGLDTLLEALAKSAHEVELVVCGTGKMEQNYQRQSEALGLSPRVRFLGHQNSDQLRKHYQRADAVVIPSRAPETFCLVGLEALANGTPVIASNTGGMNEWLKPNVNGLEFEANNSAQLAFSIDRYFSDVRLQTRLRQFALKSDYGHFAPEQHINLVHNLMTSMMEAA